jgi:hypothetical protein
VVDETFGLPAPFPPRGRHVRIRACPREPHGRVTLPELDHDRARSLRAGSPDLWDRHPNDRKFP